MTPDQERACWSTMEWGRTVTDEERAFRWSVALKIAGWWDAARKLVPPQIERGGITVNEVCRHLVDAFAETMLLDSGFSTHIMEQIIEADEAGLATLFAFWTPCMQRQPLAFDDKEAS